MGGECSAEGGTREGRVRGTLGPIGFIARLAPIDTPLLRSVLRSVVPASFFSRHKLVSSHTPAPSGLRTERLVAQGTDRPNVIM